jgi:CheY-like chemotaxis protein
VPPWPAGVKTFSRVVRGADRRHCGRNVPKRPPVGLLANLYVLLVDDNADSREIISAYLSHYGASVRVAAGAGEALSALAALRAHVVVTDISMPGMDGFDLLEEIRKMEGESERPTPVIAYTAFGNLRDAVLEAGFVSYLTKPLEPDLLVQAIAEAAGRDFGDETAEA